MLKLVITYPSEMIPDDLLKERNRGEPAFLFLGQHEKTEGIFFHSHLENVDKNGVLIITFLGIKH